MKLKQESWWGTHKTLIINPEDQLKWYENIGHNEIYMMVEQPDEKHEDRNNPQGFCCYTEIDWFARTCNLSGSAFKSCRNKIDEVIKPGFAAGMDFAFEVLNMHRVGAEVLATHSAAQRLEIGHLNFKIEGRRRDAVYKSGRYYDSVQLGILREEWESSERVKAYGGCCNKNFDHDLAEKAVERFIKNFPES
jgi:hypothetical protein